MADLKLSGLQVKKAFLFGSFANNSQTEWSDIDVALVADAFIGFQFEDRKYTSKINIQNKYVQIETRNIPTAHFLAKDPLIENIIKTGIEIF